MRRLTYAPKCYVFIRSRNHGNKVFDLTDYVVSGSVDRLVNQPSKASIILRNSFFQFSPDKTDSFFLPMDGITIWLQRLKNRPIQVFTGYLDSVPYMQLYPGNCQITASCTLKRLEHTYFDPTIQATLDFFRKMGWNMDDSGGFSNPDGSIFVGKSSTDPERQQVGSQQLTSVDALKAGGTSNDSGIGSIIKPFLKEIAGWNENQIHISHLPADLPAKGAKLYDRLSAENLSMLDALEAVLKNVMTLQADPTAAGSQTTVQLGVVKTISDAANDINIDPVIMTTAAMVLSNLDTTNVNAEGAGLYGLPDDKAGKGTTSSAKYLSSTGLDNSDFFGTVYDGSKTTYGGLNVNDVTNPTKSTRAFGLKMIAADKDKAFAKAAGKGDLNVLTTWIAKASGRNADDIRGAVATNYKISKRLVSAYTGAKVNANSPLLKGAAADLLPPSLTWSQTDKMFSGDTATDHNLFKQQYPKPDVLIEHLAPYAYVAHKNGLRIAPLPSQYAGRSDIMGFQDPQPGQSSSTKAKQFFDWAKTQGATVVRYSPAGKGKDDKGGKQTDVEYHNGLRVSGAAEHQELPDDIVYVFVSGNTPYPTWTGNPDTSSKQSNAQVPGSATDPSSTTQDSNANRPLTFEDIATIGLQSAFYAQVSFPGDIGLSQILKGDKALMNDIPVMEGVKQLCGGSMRNFMSLPDGSFCAFYPDYFGGSNRKPYWAITDMETVNMGIQLTDAALATHVYVTGATATGTGGFGQGHVEAVTTLGVVTVQHMFGDGNFVAGDIKGNTGGDILGREAEAFQFLKFYGARPLAIQQPLIRSHYFEFLYAWQLFMYMWAAQFQTQCEFTFQPEMMAGGRVAFPDHGLEFYVESVHHEFSYEAGFTTSAVLQAPATTIKNPKDRNYRPGMALAGAVDSVGAA